jgi:hypothetical protein
MKLQELAATRTTSQTAKVFESYFGQDISFISGVSSTKANAMLKRVRGLIAEERRKPSFHLSEQNPAYLKLVMMEQALATRIQEVAMGATGTPAGQQGAANPQTGSATGAPTNPQEIARAKAAQQAALNKIHDPKLKAAMQKSTAGQSLTRDEQMMVANAALSSGGMHENMENGITPDEETAQVNGDIMTIENRKSNRLYNMLKESEVQQAQVVLASQDMVDQVQKMLEQVTAMQFKDLPALVDQVKYQVGQQQAVQFNTDATAALSGLVQNLQGAKQQLEQALGVVTGQEVAIPGQEEQVDVGVEEIPGEEVDVDVDADAGVEEPEAMPGLGRERR